VNNGTLGQGGLMFGRQAYVGLTDDKLGTDYPITIYVRLGCLYDVAIPLLLTGAAPATRPE
jgi:hypothetical protein